MADILHKKNNSENNKQPDPNYWNSLEELYKDPRVIEASKHEFKEGVTDDFNPSAMSKLSRRKFLALVSASAALAGAGCSDYRSNGEIIPYIKKPEEITVGKPNYYSSTCTACEYACGILIKTREGRPIKIDGNPDHPVSKGKTCAAGQANILNLYDQERLKQPLKGDGKGNFTKVSWEQADSQVLDHLSKNDNSKVVFITNKIVSPTTKKLLDEFSEKYPTTQIISYEPFNDEIRNSAWKKCYSSGTFPLIKWDKAKIILALESDFLGAEENSVENSRLFAKGKDVKNLKAFNRLYVCEAGFSLTGSNADYRFKLKPEAQLEFVGALLNELSQQGVLKLSFDNSIFGDLTLDSFATKYSFPRKELRYLVNDLIENRGNSIVYAGKTLPESVHVAVNVLNEALGNNNIYRTDSSTYELSPLVTDSDLKNLVNDMNSGKIGMLIHFDSNPVYHLPRDLGYEGALERVPFVISLTESENESSANANYVLPINHNFESWGDAKTRTGFYSLQQPVIAPIFDTRQKGSILLTWLKGDPSSYKETIYHEYLKSYWQNEIYPALNSKLNFKEFWYGALNNGIVMVEEMPENTGSFNDTILSNLSFKGSSKPGFTVLLKESYNTKHGRFANNGWMQELPHPISKVTWDNYAAISITSASKLGVKNNDLIDININDRKLSIPIFIQPGLADGVITIENGYGRTKVGVVGTAVGFDSTLLMNAIGDISPWIYSGANITKGNGTYRLVVSQEHHEFDKGFTKDQPEVRGIIQEGTVEEYSNNPHFLNPNHEELRSLYSPHDFPGVKWGMAIDLNKCTGCGECVVACVSENNIPIVGKEQVGTDRIMHWMRIDRYYSGDPENPKVSTQPMLCQQCDHAPCENVCPVLATTHNDEGLNQMIYNRCVGTRYCSNNCPYKVRRFNFFNFRDHFNNQYQEDQLFDLVYNPEVTVRSRGVMEKCTFCIQRIMNAKSDAIREGRKVKGSDVRTACQDACNTEAIKFGDMNDKNSEFYKYRHHELGYYILEELNTRPNVTYLAKLRNLHSEEA
jgi:MoCo/4Fe-4S cofactor protein with predicted Tat translocation signal